MNSDKKTARIVGVLFIVATVFFIVGDAIYDPILSAPDYLDRAYPDRTIVVAGILLGLIGTLAVPLIPVFLFPILRHRNEALALGYVGFRFLETMLIIFVAINMLSLLNVSQEYLAAGGVGASDFRNIGSAIQSMSGWAFLISVGLTFPLGALILYSLLYRLELVPRWISVWGLIAAAVLLTGSVLSMLDVLPEMPEAGLELILAGPIAVNEMVLAVWLIVKGFNSSAIASESA